MKIFIQILVVLVFVYETVKAYLQKSTIQWFDYVLVITSVLCACYFTMQKNRDGYNKLLLNPALYNPASSERTIKRDMLIGLAFLLFLFVFAIVVYWMDKA